MTVINFDTISNESDLLDQIYDELTTNQNWTGRRNTGTVASNNIEVWLEKDPSDTVSGRRLLAGFLSTNASPSANGTSYEVRLVKGDTEWDDDENAGSAEDADFDDIGDYPDNQFVRSLSFYRDEINQAWLIVPDDDDDGLQYFYCVVQAGLLYYFCFGCGEIDKSYNFAGGEFLSHSSFRTNAVNPAQRSGFLCGSVASASSSTYTGYLYCDNGAGEVWREIGGAGAGDAFCPHNYRGIQVVYDDLNPSTDSGQFIPFPIAYFCGITDESVATNEQLEYIGNAPFAYVTSIRFLDHGETIVISGDRYLVVPFFAVEGSPDGDSAYMGLLIRTEEDS